MRFQITTWPGGEANAGQAASSTDSTTHPDGHQARGAHLPHLSQLRGTARAESPLPEQTQVRLRCVREELQDEALPRGESVVVCKSNKSSFNHCLYFLQEHFATHTGVKLHTCAFCPTEFRSKSNMYHHTKRKHKAEWERSRASRSAAKEQRLQEQIQMKIQLPSAGQAQSGPAAV